MITDFQNLTRGFFIFFYIFFPSVVFRFERLFRKTFSRRFFATAFPFFKIIYDITYKERRGRASFIFLACYFCRIYI